MILLLLSCFRHPLHKYILLGMIAQRRQIQNTTVISMMMMQTYDAVQSFVGTWWASPCSFVFSILSHLGAQFVEFHFQFA